MHFHAEHSLFFEQRQELWRPALCFGLTTCVLVVNVGASNTVVSLVGSAFGFLLLLNSHLGGRRRMEPALAWTLALVVCVALGSVALGGDLSRFSEAAARVLCGVLWVLWLGTQLDWSSLRRLLLVVRVPENVVSSLVHAVMNGILTQREWARRQQFSPPMQPMAMTPSSAGRWEQLSAISGATLPVARSSRTQSGNPGTPSSGLTGSFS